MHVLGILSKYCFEADMTKKIRTELDLSRRLAEILVYGHGLLLVYAVVVWYVGHLEGTDIVQMLLTGTPIMAMAAVAAFTHVMYPPAQDLSPPAEATQARMSQAVTVAFLVLLFVAYTAGWARTPIQSDYLKLVVGAIETGLGGYIGIIRDKFFVNGSPKLEPPTAESI
jgi:hypothetical protein